MMNPMITQIAKRGKGLGFTASLTSSSGAAHSAANHPPS